MDTGVLIAAQDKNEREALNHILAEKYRIVQADSLHDACGGMKTAGGAPDAVILDLSLVEYADLSVLQQFKDNCSAGGTPVFIACRSDRIAGLLKLFHAGITDFIFKPYDKAAVCRRIDATIDLYKSRKESGVLPYGQGAGTGAAGQTNEEKITRLLGEAIQARNPETGEHLRRVKALTGLIAADVREHYPQYNLSARDVENIAAASVMHDIGKILIPDSILLKPERLTPRELEIMKTHTTKGCELLEGARGVWGDEYADVCKDIALCHHERYDGSGYPNGLKDDEIPISAQIVAIADVYDALVTQRVYKPAMMRREAYQMIKNGECGAFSDLLLESLTRQLKNL